MQTEMTVKKKYMYYVYTCVQIKWLFLFYFQPRALKRISHLGCLITGCDSLEQPLLLMQTACNNIGLELGTDMYLAINCAAHELMDYVSYFQYQFCWFLKGR